MNRKDRRALAKAQRHNGSHGFDCGCPHLGNFVGSLICDCGNVVNVDAWMPTSSVVGDFVEVGSFCPACGSPVDGQALVVNVA